MGFLRKLFGERQPPVQVEAVLVVPDRADAVLEVVGEQSYQDTILQIAGGRDQNGPKNPRHHAMLIPEPDNKYDKNAICVRIDGLRVGYLSRDDAVRYGPVTRWIGQRGLMIGCEAHLKGGWYRGRGDAGSVGVSLHLGSPGETMLQLLDEPPPLREDHPWRGLMVAFTGDSRCAWQGMAIDRELATLLATRAGMIVHPRVTKKVQLLVDCDPGGSSGNELKAREYTIQVVAETDSWAALGLPTEDLPWQPPVNRSVRARIRASPVAPRWVHSVIAASEDSLDEERDRHRGPSVRIDTFAAQPLDRDLEVAMLLGLLKEPREALTAEHLGYRTSPGRPGGRCRRCRHRSPGWRGPRSLGEPRAVRTSRVDYRPRP